MASIPDEKVQEVRDRVDIVDLVRRYVDLRKAGRNFKGLCPFHTEKSPSFNVNPERKGYKCFGCGAGGDAISFVMELEGKSFPEAVRKLADLYGISLPAFAHGTGQTAGSTEKDEAYALMKLASERYAKVLQDGPQGEAGRAYIAARGLGSAVVEQFALGYAPAPSEAGWDFLVQMIDNAKLSLPLAERLGLVGRSERSRRYYDKFRGRLMFPVVTPGGETVAFSGRIVPPHDQPADPSQEGAAERQPPKYMNSPETMLFRKGKTLFGMPQARQAIAASKRVVLVEGNVDVVKLHQWGVCEAVAPLGTAFSLEQAQMLGRFAEQVILCFDGDNAGKKAAFAALPHLLAADLDVRMVLLPDGEDPDSVGQDRLSRLIDSAQPALELLMLRLAGRAGDSTQMRARGLDRLVPLIARVPRDTARTLYVERAADLFGVSGARLAAAVRAARENPQERAPHTSGGEKKTLDNRRAPSTSQEAVPLSAPSAAPPAAPSSPGTASGFPFEGRHSGVPRSHGAPPDGERAPSPRSQALPGAQAQLTMLLVDLPHLAGMAERCGALGLITDERLARIAAAVVEGAKQGENPTMADLLALVEEREQPRIYEAVFAGRFRADGRGGASNDPQAILQGLMHQCQEQALDDQIRDLERAIRLARAEGDSEREINLAQQRLDLRRTQAALRKSRSSGDPLATRN